MSVIKSLPPHIIKREHTTPNLRCTTTHPDTIFNLQNAHFLYEKLKYTDSRKYTRKYLTVHRLSINTINVHLESSDVHFLLTVQYNTVQYSSRLTRRGWWRFRVSVGHAVQCLLGNVLYVLAGPSAAGSPRREDRLQYYTCQLKYFYSLL